MLADLIPNVFFSGIAQDWVLWLMSAGAVALLVFGADRLVSSAVKLARTLGMSKVIIGATVVSLGTTSPEACTSVTAALTDNPGLALGNAVGSIICDTALVFGLCCLITRLPLDRFILYRHGTLKLAAGLLLTLTIVALAIVGGGIEGVVIGRSIGIMLLVLLAGYMLVSVYWSRQRPETIPVEAGADIASRRPATRVPLNLLLLAVGLAMVIFGSSVLVGSVSVLCIRYGMPPDVLAVTVVALGTSLPELVTAVTSVVKGHPEIAIGNVIGADILNVLFVVGASATAVPLAVPTTFFYFHLPVMMLALTVMGIYIFTNKSSFKRWQGVPLLAIYVGYLVILFVTFGGGQSQ